MPPQAPPRVLITRPANGNSDLADHLRTLGADPILIPAIKLAEPSSYAPLDAALAQLESFGWLLFTSANAVEAFVKRLGLRGDEAPQNRVPYSSTKSMSGESKPKTRIAAIGPATARALEKIGLTPDLLPPQAVAESLLTALLPLARQGDGTPTRFLLIRAEEARELLPEALRAAGAEVTIAPAYRTVIPQASITEIKALFQPGTAARVPHPSTAPSSLGGIPTTPEPPRVPHPSTAPSSLGGVPTTPEPPPVAAITFTSSSTARNLHTLCEQAGVTLPPQALRISIGPITTATLRELNLPPYAEAPEATVLSLAETVMRALRLHTK